MDYEKEIKKLDAQIEELKAKIESEQEAPPVWVPKYKEQYFMFDGDGVGSYGWVGDSVDLTYLTMGNFFRTKQEAENCLRALKLIETIRRERFKAQGNWQPSEGEGIYTMCWGRLENIARTNYAIWSFPPNVFGFWQDSGALIDVIEKHEPELKWYFTEYLPSIN